MARRTFVRLEPQRIAGHKRMARDTQPRNQSRNESRRLAERVGRRGRGRLRQPARVSRGQGRPPAERTELVRGPAEVAPLIERATNRDDDSAGAEPRARRRRATRARGTARHAQQEGELVGRRGGRTD